MKASPKAGTPGTHPGVEPATPSVSFQQGSIEYGETFGDRRTTLLASSTTSVSDVDVPAFGWLRSVLVIVEATGGSNNLATVAAKEDAPFSVLRSLSITDTNGRPLIGPLTGYQLYLANKWAPTSNWSLDAKLGPRYSAVDSSGNFRFVLRIPAELGGRDALGALPNQKGDSRYRIAYDVAAASDVYSTAPDTTLPTLRVRFVLEAWAPVAATTPDGHAVQVEPFGAGTTQHLSVATPEIAAGSKIVPITRVGALIRSIILVLRNNSGARTDSQYPDQLRITKDANNVQQLPVEAFRHYMWERTGNTLDTGVLVLFDGEHDLDGRTGAGLRDQWLPTTSSTRLEVDGVWGSSVGSLQVLVNDVRPAPGLPTGA